MVHRGARPRERVVGTHHDLAGARLGREVTQRLGGEDDRVVVHLLHVVGRTLLQRLRLALRERRLHGVRAVHVGRQVAAAVRRADLEAGELIERALEDQVRERDGRLQRIADGVRQQPVARQAPARLELRRAQGMHEDQHAELLGLGPEGVELRIAQLLAVDAAADASAAQAVLLHALHELLGGEVGMLERDGGEGHEAVGVRGAELLVPVGVDAERLDVDALRVHRAQARRDVLLQQGVRLQRPPHERVRRGHRAVRVDVHGLHALAVDDDLPPPGRGRLGVARRRARQVAPHEHDVRRSLTLHDVLR